MVTTAATAAAVADEVIIEADVWILLPSAPHPLEETAARLLRETLLQRGGVRRVSARRSPVGDNDFPAAVITLRTAAFPGEAGAPTAPEGFRVVVETPDDSSGETRLSASVVGADPNGVLYGVGRLLRWLRWLPGGDGFAAASLDVTEAPDGRVRGWVLSNHRQTTSYDKWEMEHWDAYLREAALWGVNTLVAYPLHAARWKGVDPWSDPPRWESEAARSEFQRQWAIQQALPLLARRYGMRFGIWNPVNDIFPYQRAHVQSQIPGLTKNEDKDRGIVCNKADYVCPSVPEARALLTDLRRHVFEGLAHVDFMFLPSGDDGGCPCDACAPWVETYLSLVREQADLLRQYHPQAEVWVSNQKLPLDQTDMLIDFLHGEERPSFVTGFCQGPFSGGTEFADQGLDRVQAGLAGSACDIVLYPDVTHISRCQFPIPHADPGALNLFRREDGPFARPLGYRDVFLRNQGWAAGSILYSEGSHDAMNLALWAQWEWDRNKSGEDAAREYCRWYFGDDAAPEALAAVLLKEENWSRPIAENADISRVTALVEAADTKIPAALRQNNWRWKLIQIEASLFQYLQSPTPVLRNSILLLRDEIFALCRLETRACGRI